MNVVGSNYQGELVEHISEEEPLGEWEGLELEYWSLVAGEGEAAEAGGQVVAAQVEQVEHLHPGLLVPVEVGPHLQLHHTRAVEHLQGRHPHQQLKASILKLGFFHQESL